MPGGGMGCFGIDWYIMYTVQQLMIKCGLSLILSFPKAWFLLRIRRSNFCCFLHRGFQIPEGIAYSASKTGSIAAEQRTESFVGISRQKQHLRPLCGTTCKCELYCLNKRSRHFIDQQVITFQCAVFILYSKISTDPGLLKIRHSHRFVAVVIQILITFHTF